MGARQWPRIPPGGSIPLPEGTERMGGGVTYWIYYNPRLNRSYYIAGSPAAGYDVIEYPYPLCPRCWERYRRFHDNGV